MLQGLRLNVLRILSGRSNWFSVVPFQRSDGVNFFVCPVKFRMLVILHRGAPRDI